MSNFPIPAFATFTGVDDRTNLTKAAKLAERYPIEWGVLFSASNRDARYPCSQAIDEIINMPGRLSAHLCGSIAMDAIDGLVLDSRLSRFGRIQVNARRYNNYENIERFGAAIGADIIIQKREEFDPDLPLSQLYDCSGGRGQIPSRLPPIPDTQDSEIKYGYAGGMGPDTVGIVLDRIPAASGAFWIDMETNVRTNGWFDLSKCQKVCELIWGDGCGVAV